MEECLLLGAQRIALNRRAETIDGVVVFAAADKPCRARPSVWPWAGNYMSEPCGLGSAGYTVSAVSEISGHSVTILQESLLRDMA